MKWELERHDWKRIDQRLIDMPTVIDSLVGAPDPSDAKVAYWRIDSIVVRNGRLLLGAAQVCECLVQGLLSASPAGRTLILELLVQFGGGVGENTASGKELADRVHREVFLGLPIYAELVETGDRVDRFHCIDLLSICAGIDAYSRDRIRSLLLRAAKCGDGEEQLVRAIFDDLNL